MAQYADIFEAIRKNDIEAVKAFLPDQLEARDGNSRTPLHHACMYNYIEIVRLLLDRGADINTRDKEGCTSLHIACFNGSATIVCLLCDSGADIGARDNTGSTPLHCACLTLFYDVDNIPNYLVAHGADPFAIDSKGKFAIDYDTEIVKDESGNKIPHRQILIQLRAEYLNKNTIKESERTAVITSGWEMEM